MSMATSGSTTNTEDPWGLPSSQVSNPSQRVSAHAATVPDDWDAEDGQDEDEPDAQELWDTANSRAPMPQIQPSTTSTPAGAQLPPAAAFEAPLRILKRPSPAGSKSPSPLNGQTPKSFKEREAQYQAARERIFGEEPRDKALGLANDKAKATRTSERPNIIRDPIGPATGSADGEAKRGFRTRRKKGDRAMPMDPANPQEAVQPLVQT